MNSEQGLPVEPTVITDRQYQWLVLFHSYSTVLKDHYEHDAALGLEYIGVEMGKYDFD